ncbi:urease accessory protein UreE [Sulfurisphaera tokodaii]|uniref:Urease accessory protein UreE n=2 Tax=Sulfurisphaera tokodaii TaxID=111955 RepID=Q972W1_SULTO|nr:urease accessory protein UreE [Sulfurisphaera tokodaii]BAB66052.1 putative urease accessory protein UreE [Sulfurisphaera tokodaii str. 7]HII74016.1 urease accessory protein UreE [Sulfurisphaera tokodaii]
MILAKKLGKESEAHELIEKAKALGIFRIVELSRECFERQRCRGKTDKGEEVIINLKGVPISDGDVFQTDNGYIILLKEKEEKVVEFKINDFTSFILGYIIGNYHMRVMVNENKVYISAELGEDYLTQKFKNFNPKVTRIKFNPNVDIPVQPVVVDFVNT